MLLPVLLIQEAGEGLRKVQLLTATVMGGIMMLMRERRAAVLWGLGIIRLRILILGRSALRGIMEALQQTRLQLAMVPALRGIIVLPEALLQLAQDNALPDIIALPGLAAQRRMYVEQGITALLEVQE